MKYSELRRQLAVAQDALARADEIRVESLRPGPRDAVKVLRLEQTVDLRVLLAAGRIEFARHSERDACHRFVAALLEAGALSKTEDKSDTTPWATTLRYELRVVA